MSSKTRYKLIWLLLIACVVRTAMLIALGEQISADPAQDVDRYLHLAESLAQSSTYQLHGQPTAFRPVLYPLAIAAGLKAGFTAKLWITILHVLLGVATVGLTYLLGTRLQNEKTGWLAGLLVTVDPILLHQSALVMTETMATFLAVLTMVCIARLLEKPGPLNVVLVAISFGLAGYCRPTFYVSALFTLGLLLLVLQTGKFKRLLATFAIGCIVLLILSPWVYRNYQLFQKPIPATTHGGYTLLLGNNPLYYQQLDNESGLFTATEFDEGVRRFNVSSDPSYDFWSAEASIKPAVITRNESQRDRFAYLVAFHHIQKNPASFMQGCLARLKAFWSPLPAEKPGVRNDMLRYSVGIWYVLIYLLAANFTLFHGRHWFHSALFAGFCMVLSFSLMHSVFWSDMRMRAPLIPVLCLVAAASFTGLKSKSTS